MKCWLFLLILIGEINVSYSQKNSINYNSTDGLASDIVYSIHSDYLGRLWFATDNGVSMYDGSEFTNYSVNEGVADTEILSVFEDSKRRIWFLSYNGKLSYYLKGEIYNSTTDSKLSNLKSTSYFHRAVELKDGSIIFQTHKDGIFELEPDGDTKHLFPNQYCELIPNESSPKLYVKFSTGKGEIDYYPDCNDLNSKKKDTGFYFLNRNISVNDRHIIASKGKFTDQASSLLVFNNSINIGDRFIQKIETEFNYIQFFKKKNDSIILIGADSEVWELELNNFHLKKSEVFNRKPSSIIFDYEGGTWISTLGDGVFYRPNKSVSKILDAPCTKMIQYQDSILVGAKGSLIICSLDGHHRELIPLAKDDFVADIYQMNPDSFLLSTASYCGLLYHNKISQIKSIRGSKHIHLYEDSLYSAGANGLQVLSKANLYSTPNKKLSQRYSKSLHFNGDLYLGAPNGLFIIKENEILPKYNFESKITGLLTFQDKLIISSKQEGISLIDQNGERKIKYFGKEIEKIVLANNNEITIWTEEKIYVFSCGHLGKITFKSQIDNYNYIDIKKLGDTYFLTSSEGLYEYKGKANVHHKPRLIIKEILVDNTWINETTDQIELNSEEALELSFSAIGYKDRPYNYQYRVGHGDWKSTSSRSLELQNFEIGTNELYLRAVSARGEKSEAYKLLVIKSEVWYKSIYFIVLCIFVILGLGFIISFKRRKKFMRKIKFQNELLYAKQDAYRAKMNPHFIFNALNSIQNLIQRKDNDNAQKYLKKFSDLMRSNLDTNQNHFTTIKEEVDFLLDYLNLEKLRADYSFSYDIKIDKELDQENDLVPAMMIQPLIENALWHGIKNVNEGEISLEFILRDQYIFIQVTDNGVGFTKSKNSNNLNSSHISASTELNRKRIEILNKEFSIDLSLTIVDNLPNGTKATIKFLRDV